MARLSCYIWSSDAWRSLERSKFYLCFWGRGAEGAAALQFVGQTKPVGQYSLHSWAILAYYKNKWDKFCQFCGTNSVNFVGNMLSKGIFRNHFFPPPVDNNFGKFLRKIFFDNAGTIRKSRANFFPPP